MTDPSSCQEIFRRSINQSHREIVNCLSLRGVKSRVLQESNPHFDAAIVIPAQAEIRSGFRIKSGMTVSLLRSVRIDRLLPHASECLSGACIQTRCLDIIYAFSAVAKLDTAGLQVTLGKLTRAHFIAVAWACCSLSAPTKVLLLHPGILLEIPVSCTAILHQNLRSNPKPHRQSLDGRLRE